MSGDLPRGWAEIEIGDLTAPVRPRCTPQEYPRLPFVGMEQVESYSGRLIGTVSSSTMKSTAFQFQPGDILYGRLRPYLNKVLYAELMGLCSSEFIVLPPMGSFDPKYLAFYLRTDGFVSFANQLNQGDRPRVNFGQISSHEVPLAPLAEQKRIVAKVEKMLAKVDASRARMEKVSALLKRFRQSILAAACSGRLTADWREDKGAEDDLPAGWSWTPLQRLLPKGGIFDGPFGSNLKSSDYTDSGVRVIRLENIGQLRFIGEKETFISREKYANLKKHTVGEGDIIFASFVAGEVRACLLPALSTKAIAKADCFCLRPNSELVDRKYLLFQLVSQKSFNTLFEEIHGATRPRINTTQLRELEIRLCPFPEQLEIVRRVEELFALADRLEARVGKARGQVDKLTQSILVKAFRGELVPQDPNDEPTEKLLARIRAATGPVAVQGGKVASSVSVRRGRPRKVR